MLNDERPKPNALQNPGVWLACEYVVAGCTTRQRGSKIDFWERVLHGKEFKALAEKVRDDEVLVNYWMF